MPRIFCFRPNQNVWGYKVDDFAPEILEFLRQGYSELTNEGYQGIYVRNDYYYEALSILKNNRILFSYKTSGNVGQILNGDVIEQQFISYRDDTIQRVDLYVGTYARINNSTLEIILTDLENGASTVLASEKCDCFIDNSWVRIETLPFAVEKGKHYKLSLISPDGSDGNSITVAYGDRAVTNKFWSYVRGIEKPMTLAIRIYGSKEEKDALVKFD